MSELKTIARGWRWLRPSPRPRHIPAPPLKTEASFETDWARKPWANVTRDYLQELVLLPALRYLAAPNIRGRVSFANADRQLSKAASRLATVRSEPAVVGPGDHSPPAPARVMEG